MRSKSWRFKNLLTTSAPKVNETPLSFSPQPLVSLSGSDHSKSQRRPEKRYKRYFHIALTHYFCVEKKARFSWQEAKLKGTSNT